MNLTSQSKNKLKLRSIIKMKMIYIFIILKTIICVRAWDTEELEIFDLVEEVNRNFYEVLGLKQEAISNEIKKAFRNLSVSLHPDKNKAENANEKFRIIVAVYEVLKDSSKRAKYDKVLKDGLPNWKSALYYYRRVRKLGLLEGSLIIFFIFTIGQYLYAWASYLEKKYTIEQILESKMKKLLKKKRSETLETIFDDMPLPSFYNTLPFQIPVLVWNFPKQIQNVWRQCLEFREEEIKKNKTKQEETKFNDMQKAFYLKEKLKSKEFKKRKVVEQLPEKSDADLMGYSQLKSKYIIKNDSAKCDGHVSINGGIWTDEDITLLTSLVNKYSLGVQKRWEIISKLMGRSVAEVTFMATNLKENNLIAYNQLPNYFGDNINKNNALNECRQSSKGDILIPHKDWSQAQQKSLENAIILYKNHSADERWCKIAQHVPGKSKEECQVRYKYLVQLVKNSKNNNESNIVKNCNIINNIEKNSMMQDHNNEYCNIGNEDEGKTNGGKKKNVRKQQKKQQVTELYDVCEILH